MLGFEVVAAGGGEDVAGEAGGEGAGFEGDEFFVEEVGELDAEVAFGVSVAVEAEAVVEGFVGEGAGAGGIELEEDGVAEVLGLGGVHGICYFRFAICGLRFAIGAVGRGLSMHSAQCAMLSF